MKVLGRAALGATEGFILVQEELEGFLGLAARPRDGTSLTIGACVLHAVEPDWTRLIVRARRDG